MSVTALFRGKWGQKTQDSPVKHPATVLQHSQEDYDEDDSKVGLSRDPIRRNSRFYRSMRKKRMVSSEQSESKKTSSISCANNLTSYLCCILNCDEPGLIPQWFFYIYVYLSGSKANDFRLILVFELKQLNALFLLKHLLWEHHCSFLVRNPVSPYFSDGFPVDNILYVVALYHCC